MKRNATIHTEEKPLASPAFLRRRADLRNRWPSMNLEWLDALATLHEERAKIDEKRIAEGFRLAESKGHWVPTDIVGLICEFTPLSDIEATYPAAGGVLGGKRYVLFRVDHHGGYQGCSGHFADLDSAYLGVLDDAIRLMERNESPYWKPRLRMEKERVNGLPLNAITWDGMPDNNWTPWGVIVATSAKVNLEQCTQEKEGETPDPDDEMDEENHRQFWRKDVDVQLDAIVAKYDLN